MNLCFPLGVLQVIMAILKHLVATVSSVSATQTVLFTIIVIISLGNASANKV